MVDDLKLLTATALDFFKGIARCASIVLFCAPIIAGYAFAILLAVAVVRALCRFIGAELF